LTLKNSYLTKQCTTLKIVILQNSVRR